MLVSPALVKPRDTHSFFHGAEHGERQTEGHTHIERKRDRDTATERKARHVTVLGAVHEKMKKPSSRKLKVNMRSAEIFHLE